MADTLGNLSLTDMKWLGEPADPATRFISGAREGQRMLESAEMHPLRMEGLKAQTEGVQAQTSLAKQRHAHGEVMNPLIQANQKTTNLLNQQKQEFDKDSYSSRLATINATTSLVESQARVAEKIEADKVLQASLQSEQMENTLQRQAHDLKRASINAERADQSLDAYEFDLDLIHKLYQDGRLEELNNYAPSKLLTLPQREQVMKVLTEIKKRPAALAANLAMHQADLLKLNNAEQDIATINKLQQSDRGWWTDLTTGSEAVRAGYITESGELTSAGRDALDASQKWKTLKANGAWTQDEEDMMQGGMRGANYKTFRNGKMVVPNEQMLQWAQEKVRSQKEAFQATKLQQEFDLKSIGELHKWYNTNVNDLGMEPDEAFAKATVQAGVADKTIHLARTPQDLLRLSAEGKGGEAYYNPEYGKVLEIPNFSANGASVVDEDSTDDVKQAISNTTAPGETEGMVQLIKNWTEVSDVAQYIKEKGGVHKAADLLFKDATKKVDRFRAAAKLAGVVRHEDGSLEVEGNVPDEVAGPRLKQYKKNIAAAWAWEHWRELLTLERLKAAKKYLSTLPAGASNEQDHRVQFKNILGKEMFELANQSNASWAGWLDQHIGVAIRHAQQFKKQADDMRTR